MFILHHIYLCILCTKSSNLGGFRSFKFTQKEAALISLLLHMISIHLIVYYFAIYSLTLFFIYKITQNIIFILDPGYNNYLNTINVIIIFLSLVISINMQLKLVHVLIFFSALSEDTCRVTSTPTKTLCEDVYIYLSVTQCGKWLSYRGITQIM